MALRGLVELQPDPAKRLKHDDLVDIYVNLTDAKREQYEREYPEETKTMQSFSTRMREEGIQLGEATVLLFQLEQKFGPVPEETRQYIEQAKPDTLLRWSGRVLTEDSIEDVLR